MRITESRLKEILGRYDEALDRNDINTLEDLLSFINLTIDVQCKDNEVMLVNQNYSKGATAISVLYHLYQNGTPMEISIYPTLNYTIITLYADRLMEGYHPCTDKPIDRFGNTRQERVVPDVRVMRAADILPGYAKK